MEESQLDGGLTLVRMILNQPELRLVDLTDGHTLNRFIKEFDKRPIIKQIEQAVSVFLSILTSEVQFFNQ